MKKLISEIKNKEEIILAEILNEPEFLVEAADKLQEEDFTETNRDIYSLILALYKQNKLTIGNVQIRSKKDLSYLLKKPITMDKSVLMDYVDQIKEVSAKRKFYNYFGDDIWDKPLSEILNDTNEIINKIILSQKEDKPADIKSVWERMLKEISEIETNKDKIFYTGFKKFDQATMGIMKRHIWMLGGWTGMGKSLWLIELLRGFLERGARIIVFSNENTDTRNLARLAGSVIGEHDIKIIRNKAGDKLKEAEKILDYKLWIYDSVYDTDKMRQIIKRHKMQEGVDVVMIDYLQNCNPHIPQIYEKMVKVATDIQTMAIDLDVSFVGVNQVAKSESLKDEDDIFTTFKGATEITNIADVVMLIRGKTKNKFKKLIQLKKIRHGVPCEIEFDFLGENNERYFKEEVEEFNPDSYESNKNGGTVSDVNVEKIFG